MKLNENQKITLTIGHIKKLVKESKNVGDSKWFRRDVERIVSEEFHANIYDLKCYYDGDDSFINRRDFVIEGRFGYREDRRYSAEKNRLYAAIRKAGGTNIIGRVFNNGGFDVAFDIQEKKLAEYRAKEEKWQAEQDSEKAAEMDIIRQEVESFDISKYKPNEKILDKIKAYKDKGSKVNVKAISGYEKLLTYYWAAAILGWDDLMNDIKRKLMSEDFYRLGKVEGDSGSGVYMFKFPELSVIDKLQKRFMQLKWLWGEGSPDGEFILGILNKIKQEAMKKMNENTKVTLTLDQLKRLVKEAIKSSSKDFVIDDGVLVDYHGKGGDVVIPDGVKSIGETAFSGCSRLKSVTIPDSVTSIENAAFQYCSGLTSVVIPKSVSFIKPYAFYCCYNLKSVTLPDSVKEIGDYAFSGCESITSMTIPNGTKLGENAFDNVVLAKCTHGNIIYAGVSIIPDEAGERYKSIRWKSPWLSLGEYIFYITTDGDFRMICRYPSVPERYPLSGHPQDRGAMICQNVDIAAAENFVKRLFRKVESLSNVTWSELTGIIDKQVAKFKDSCAKAGGNTEEHPWWYGTSDHMRD